MARNFSPDRGSQEIVKVIVTCRESPAVNTTLVEMKSSTFTDPPDCDAPAVVTVQEDVQLGTLVKTLEENVAEVTHPVQDVVPVGSQVVPGVPANGVFVAGDQKA
jgi:hypothetical protein